MAEYLCIYGTQFGWNSKGRFLMKPRMSQRKNQYGSGDFMADDGLEQKW